MSNLSTTNEPEVTQAVKRLVDRLYDIALRKDASGLQGLMEREIAAFEAKIRDALLAKYEPKPDPLLAEADELLAKYWEALGFTADTIGRARAGKLRDHTHHKAVLFTLQQRDKEI